MGKESTKKHTKYQKQGSAQHYSSRDPMPEHHSNSNFENEGDIAQLNPDLPERIRRHPRQAYRSATFDQKNTQSQTCPYTVKLNPNIRRYFDAERANFENPDFENWLKSPEIPINEEVNLHADAVVSLPRNRINRPYKSCKKYVETHYSLLREDAVSPLRDALDRYKKTPGMLEDQNTNIYEKVHLTRLTFTQNGIAARIKFSTARSGKRIQWSSSKRLISGMMVALSPSNDLFQHQCIIAIVAARPLDLVNESPPQVDLYFSRPEEIEIDPQKEFIMIEAKSGYFEAHRYTLTALQKLRQERFPFSDHIVRCNPDIQTPKYRATHPNVDLSAIASLPSASQLVKLDILKQWPDPSVTESIDSTQLAALQQILTKSFAVIQGPPGTGKTHVSVIALKILLQNRQPGDPPIIVAAQTNHALDQLLEHIAAFEPDYIRLGGRSTSSEVRKRALYEVRNQERINNVPGSGLLRSRNRLEALTSRIGNLLEIYKSGTEPISVELFHRLGVLSEKQANSLENALSGWISADSDNTSAIKHWLHRSLVPFQPVYREEQFGFEEAEEDLELEQLKECEAEHGVADVEDIEMLRGAWHELSDTWAVVEPSNKDIQKAKVLLSTCEDLWVVPDTLRGAVYWVMREQATSKVLASFRETAVEYCDLVRELKIGRWEKDAVYLGHANLIGMTTTGLSKYRALIASLEPKIILIEEAAEIIEAPVAVACVESLEHLILVGDHLQLRGHCAVKDLEGPDFNLNVSMFERLVKMNIPFKTLLRQRRMRPEFRMLISSLYPDLVDHPVVTNRNPPEWGTGQIRSFFFTHSWLEAKDETSSTFNEEEAAMVAKFYRHLMNNGVPPAAITILTFYNGHRKKLLKEIRNDPLTNMAYANVKTVDSFQGKESSIIILSLVRNNARQNIGFLDNANRVCVALSRARDGLYIFGNADIITQNPLWHDVISQMAITHRIGSTFPVQCSQHGKRLNLEYPADWAKCPEGGCDQLCNDILPCGHICKSTCHGYEHDTMQCREKCTKILICNHACQKECHEKCSCPCPDYTKLTIAMLHAESNETSGPVTAVPTGPGIPCSAVTAAQAHHGDEPRSAGPGRTRFVQDFDVGSSK